MPVKEGEKGLILTRKDRLIHYYEKFGYVNLGVSESVHGGAVWYDMLLEFINKPDRFGVTDIVDEKDGVKPRNTRRALEKTG